MSYSLEEFCSDCRAALSADSGPGGRQRVVDLLEKLLANDAFVDAHLGPDPVSRRDTVYEDPDYKFCVLFHHYGREGGGTPHDHGASWAVYGQAREYTDIKEFKRLDGGANGDNADLEVTREFRMNPGKAALFDVGVIHSINFPPGGRVVRVTGTDLDKIPKLRFDLKNKKELRWDAGPAGS